MNTFVIDPAVTTPVRKYLCFHGVPQHEMDDTVAEIQVRALEAVDGGASPKNVGEWQKLVIRIARNYLIDQARREKVADKYDDGLTDEADEHVPIEPSGEPRDPVDARRQLAVLLEMFDRGEMPELGREILEAVADRVKIPQIGRELGLPAKEVRKRLRTMRGRYFKRLGALGMLVLTMVMFTVFAGPGGVAMRDGAPPAGEPTVPKEVTPSPVEMAAVLRKEAFAACEAGRWEQCEARLDFASELDPAGEHTTQVQQARTRVNDGRELQLREFEAKPR